MRPLRYAVIGVAAMTGMPAALQARTMEERLQAACAADIRALCPDRSPDDMKACMLRKRAQVGAACIRLIDASE